MEVAGAPVTINGARGSRKGKHHMHHHMRHIVLEEDAYNDMIKGGSIGDIFRRIKNVFTNETSIETEQTLKKYGDYRVNRFRIHRNPIQSALKSILNALTLGKFKRETAHYDDVYHLFCVFELVPKVGKKVYMLTEKRPAINWSHKTDLMGARHYITHAQSMNGLYPAMRDGINPSGKTLSQMVQYYINKHPNNWWKYDPVHMNCQEYIQGLLHGIDVTWEDEFIKQDIDNAVTPLAHEVAKGVTDVGAFFSRIFGAGEPLCGAGLHDYEMDGKGVPKPYIRNEALRKAYDLANTKDTIRFPDGMLTPNFSRVFPYYYFWDDLPKSSGAVAKRFLPHTKKFKVHHPVYAENHIRWDQSL